jgi:hypothetical protein
MSKQTNDFQQLIAMVVELLEGGVVEESKEFEDPDTGSPREVDVYALVRGKANGQDIRIAVDCVDRSKKMGAPWVEGIWGKHDRLQVADIVLLVSSKGFFRPAEKLARRLGYKTITPAIAPMRLARTLGLADNAHMSVKVTTILRGDVTINVGVPGEYVDDGHFRRADDSELVTVGDFRAKVLVDEVGMSTLFMSAEATDSERTVKVSDPVYDGEALHVRLRRSDGQLILAPVNFVQFTAKVSSTNRADLAQSELGDFDGVPFGTGVSTIGGHQARMVVTEDADGNWKALTKFQHEVPTDDDQA